jgi:hypothetical protein
LVLICFIFIVFQLQELRNIEDLSVKSDEPEVPKAESPAPIKSEEAAAESQTESEPQAESQSEPQSEQVNAEAEG